MARVIVIEDDPTMLEALVSVLKAQGHDVQGTLQSKVGVQLIRDHLPDLVLCDINMPHFDGYEVVHELRIEPATAAIPIIFLTAKTGRQAMRKGMEVGASDYITKPFSVRELVAAVDMQIEKQDTMAAKYETTLKLLRKNISYALPHELKTPLAGILGFSEVLQSEYETLELHEIGDIATQIIRSAQRLHHVIENYLVYTQLESIATDTEQQEALRNHTTENVDTIIADQALQKVRQFEREADIVLELENIALQISEDNLRKIVDELVDNACKFSEPGSTILVQSIQETDRYILHIQDYGRGMTAKQIKRIGAYMQFDRMFYEQQGLGLGLVIVQHLVELHEAQFIVESDPGQGTLIRIAFPIH